MPKKKTKVAPKRHIRAKPAEAKPVPKIDVPRAIADLEALKLSGVGRAFEPANLDPIIAILKG